MELKFDWLSGSLGFAGGLAAYHLVNKWQAKEDERMEKLARILGEYTKTNQAKIFETYKELLDDLKSTLKELSLKIDSLTYSKGG